MPPPSPQIPVVMGHRHSHSEAPRVLPSHGPPLRHHHTPSSQGHVTCSPSLLSGTGRTPVTNRGSVRSRLCWWLSPRGGWGHASTGGGGWAGGMSPGCGGRHPCHLPQGPSAGGCGQRWPGLLPRVGLKSEERGTGHDASAGPQAPCPPCRVALHMATRGQASFPPHPQPKGFCQSGKKGLSKLLCPGQDLGWGPR